MRSCFDTARSTFRQTVASVVCSRMSAIASRTSRMMILVPHVSTSTHSSHGRKRVSLAQGNGANGPSIIRITDASVIVSGDWARLYPPPLPFLLTTIPPPFRASSICSRNLFGIASSSASCVIRTGPYPSLRAKAYRARRQYTVRFDNCRIGGILMNFTPNNNRGRWVARLRYS